MSAPANRLSTLPRLKAVQLGSKTAVISGDRA